MNITNRYCDNVNYNLNNNSPDEITLFSLENYSEKLQEKLKGRRQLYHFSTSSINLQQ